MKINFEQVKPDADSSFRILWPKLNHVFYWHFHPEYEIVFIDGADGTRHVGDHIERFKESDLVFIGPNIPHLNFDYGIQTSYEKVVVQMKEDFLIKAFLNIPELTDVHTLFEKARHGVCFHGETKKTIGAKLKTIGTLDHFHQLIDRAHLQDKVHNPVVIDVQFDSSAFVFLETRCLGGDPVVPNWQEGRAVLACTGGSQGTPDDLPIGIQDLNYGSGYNRTTAVADHSQDSSADFLCRSVQCERK